VDQSTHHALVNAGGPVPVRNPVPKFKFNTGCGCFPWFLGVCVYYCRAYYKSVCGEEGDSEGHVL
jgi:hypothetical protein